MSTEEIIYDLDEIVEFKARVPLGEYVVRVKDIQLGMSKSDEPAPTLNVSFEVQDGEFAAEDLFKSYSLKIFTMKTGQRGCMGISDIRSEARAVGEESKLPKRISHSELRKVYAQIFGKKKLILIKGEQADNKGATNSDGTTKIYPRLTIVGVAGKGGSTSDSSTNQLAELGL